MAANRTNAVHKVRLHRIKRFFGTVAGLTLIYFAAVTGYSLANSSLFDLVEIAVAGNVTVSREEIVALSGIRIGTNLMNVSRLAAAESIRTQPYIKEAEVARIFPNRLEIRVTERVPLAIISYDERYLVLDENGYCLTEIGLATAESWVLPVIRSSSESIRILPGERSADKGVLAALSLIQQLDPLFMENIQSFEAPSAERVAVINTDGLRVLFGQPEDLDRKLQNYEELLLKNAEMCNADTLHYVDLRYDTQITLNWKR